MAKVVRELAKDPATVRLRFPTPYGIFELDRYIPGTNIPPVMTGEFRVKSN